MMRSALFGTIVAAGVFAAWPSGTLGSVPDDLVSCPEELLV